MGGSSAPCPLVTQAVTVTRAKLLRPDIHKFFDNRSLAIVPKAAGTEVSAATASSSPQYVTHILLTGAAEYWPTYHNTLVHSLGLYSSDSRHIIRLYESSDADTEGTRMKRKTEFLSGAELKNSYGGGGSKNATPKKRSAADDDNIIESGDSSVDGDFWDDMMYD
ncbi:hypothetical protein AJ80_04486 [Polytolypa hystricis UAMH7299]|uniref:Uncharacterized protein n=1 Tax=Polytolypa hystricis (strain UAMH7299) TaxID=1447883 RepID=A0A2B7YAG0_POLH7|nr:hypothetical protein AJ80_04486 [Polytolypa hystricis UAMH7299]